ncbi:TfoX/Sxy family protein [Paractinoplanes lichenicola]|uniref:TfoX/Sxy family protein n=1 Tax=Paractinoplanes lichenicola TaxID=2802976 RepID=A0ABS1W5Q3_9ACTN|nr:TfoX/Sxy family protein [Actinoplanes lichenicola]MBL7261903.1 TfoX/Sxy family protein [Actinoplanes lichenicola]
MAYDEVLAQRLRDRLTDPAVTERKMFGGLAFFTNGNMTVGVTGDALIVRLGVPEVEAAMSRPGVRPFEGNGRVMKSWLLVAGDHLDDAALDSWLAEALDYVTGLPAK